MSSHCAMCGHRGEFRAEEKAAIRDDARCANCRSMQRQRDLAQVIVDEFGRGLGLSLEEVVKRGLLDDCQIYEVGIKGPFGPRLSRVPGYTRSYFWEDVPLGAKKDGVRCEDLRQLTFASDSFDLIVSAEVLEHVFDLPDVLREIARVLKPGGIHAFSIPNRYPFPTESKARAVMVDGTVTHLVDPHYHVAGDGSRSLVVTDFGADLVRLHAEAGLRLSIVRRSAPAVPQHQNATFVARRIR